MGKICGIDEAGRGALAGPLVMAACVLDAQISGLDDSKKLTPLKRERVFNELCKSSKFLIVYFSNTQIDTLGLSWCLNSGLNAFKRYFNGYELIFDGNINYGTDIKTIIKADAKIKEVSAASILAKVSRDRLMSLFDSHYPQYGFKKHKGYGTKEHLKAIEIYGLCDLSRASFKIKNEPKLIF